MVAFPLIGLVVAHEDGAIISSWYLESEESAGTTLGACPYNDYDEELHDIVDLSGCTYEEYSEIKEGHHESTVTIGKSGEWEFHRTNQEGKNVSRRFAKR